MPAKPSGTLEAGPDQRRDPDHSLVPLIGIIVFTGIYPKPMLDRIEPAVDSLITHIEERTGYDEPQPTLAEPEPAEPAEPARGEGDG